MSSEGRVVSRETGRRQGFKDLLAWQKAYQLALEVYRLTRSFPHAEQYGLTSQIQRAAISVSANIAEGYGRHSSKKEYLQFLSIARGSLSELETCLLLTKDLGYITMEQFEEVKDLLDETGRLLYGLIDSLRTKVKLGISVLSSLLATLYSLLIFSCAAPPKPPELVWPLPPDEPRIKYVKSISTSADIEKRTVLTSLSDLLFGQRRSARLGKPYAVHVDKDGRILVADSAWRSILLFDVPAQQFKLVGLEGPGILSKPLGVTTDAKGQIYVTDTVQNRAVVYDRDGNFLMAIGERGRFEQPVGIAVNDNLNRAYIVDTQKHNVSVFDTREGRFLFDFGVRGKEDGQFNWPTNIVIDKSGKVYVMDTFNFRVQVFDADGGLITKFGNVGRGLGQFAKPKGIGVDSEGHVYVVDAAFNNVQIFDEQGQLLLFFGEMGNRPGQFWLPAGLYVDDQDQIYVADQYNRRINVYQYLGRVYQAKQAKQVQAGEEKSGK